MGSLNSFLLKTIKYNIENFSNSSTHAADKKLRIKFSLYLPSKILLIKEFKIPAGKQSRMPSTKTIKIVILGSLNLSEVKKK